MRKLCAATRGNVVKRKKCRKIFSEEAFKFLIFGVKLQKKFDAKWEKFSHYNVGRFNGTNY
jgi:hypothetical protein